MVKNLPNLISVLRLILSPYVLIFAYRGETLASLLLFFTLLLSDALDGFLARTLNARTRLGKMIDPLADKVLLLFGFISLLLTGEYRISILLLKLMVVRDLILVGGTLFLRKVGFVPQPSIWGKSATLVLGITVLAGYGLNFSYHPLLVKAYYFLQFLSGTLIVVSGFDYARKGVIFLRSKLIMERR